MLHITDTGSPKQPLLYPYFKPLNKPLGIVKSNAVGQNKTRLTPDCVVHKMCINIIAFSCCHSWIVKHTVYEGKALATSYIEFILYVFPSCNHIVFDICLLCDMEVCEKTKQTLIVLQSRFQLMNASSLKYSCCFFYSQSVGRVKDSTIQ